MFRSPISSGPWAATRSTTSRRPCRSSISATCVTCRCRFRSAPGSSWPTTATGIIGRAWPGGSTTRQGQQFAREKSRLCCAWRRSNPTKDGLHTILDVRGRGHYVGNFLQVHTRFGGWWGEGDTIFHLDGKKITHTPGTEDEYGACWGFGNTYSYLYSGYLQNDKGNNRMYRWYLANPVRFRESLKVEIQNQHDNGTPTTTDADDYTSIAYWYQESPHQAVSLQPYAERTAPSKAGVGKAGVGKK